MQYDFDHAVPRRGTYSMKYDDKAFFESFVPNIRLDDNTIRLMLADMDFHCAPAITRALHRVADFGNYGYVTVDSAPEFRQSIVAWYKHRFNCTIHPEEIVYSCGALDGVEQTIASFSHPGDGVILLYPVYSHFTSSVLRLGRKIVSCHMEYDGNSHYSIPWESFETVCADPTNKVFVLCSPSNPLGIVWTPEELERMATICRTNNVVLVSDEIHSDLIRQGSKHTPIIAATTDRRNLVMVSGPNKAFNLMGLHCAYSIIPDPTLRAHFCEGYVPVQPTAFALAAMIAAYTECDDWLDQLNAYLDANLHFAVEYLHRNLPKVKVHMPEGTYMLWMDFSAYGLGTRKLAAKTNLEANVCIDLGIFSDPEQGEHFLRMSVACPRPQLKEALQRLHNTFQSL